MILQADFFISLNNQKTLGALIYYAYQVGVPLDRGTPTNKQTFKSIRKR